MNKMTNLFKKTALVALLVALLVAALPLTSVFAAASQDTATPPAPTPVSTDRLENAWAREQNAYSRIGQLLDRAPTMIENIQALIDKAKANGKDVSAVQAALDTFSAAVQSVQPVYKSIGDLIASHPGFDANGKVTDSAQATQTVKEVHADMLQIRDLLRGSGRALREAIRAFRIANQPAQPTPSGSGGA